MTPEQRGSQGQRVGHTRLSAVLGEGGMGTVLVGFDETLHRRVAVKVIRNEFRLQPKVKARFLREARILSQLDHVNVCRVFDYVEGDEQYSGSGSEEFALSLYHLGVVHAMRGESERSAELLLRSLDIFERLQDPDAAQLGRNLNAMANLERRRGRFDEAEALFHRALTIWENAGVPQHRMLEFAIDSLVWVLRQKDRSDEATALLARWFEIRRRSSGRIDARALVSAEKLIDLEVAIGREEQALVFWTDLERSLRGEPGAKPAESERSSLCARLYLKAGRIQHGLGRQDEAHTSWRKAVEIATPLAGDGADPQVLDTLTRSLLMLGEVESARPYAEELLGRDWQGRDLLDLCREHGITDREAVGR